MGVLADRRQEAFAQGMARVVRTRAACAQAGNPHRHASRLANRPQVKQRIDEIVEERTWGGSRDLVGLIGQLKILLESTKKVKSAAAMMAAKAIISEAARLKLLLPRDEPMAVDDRLENLTQEEWTRRYGPPAP